MLSCNNITKIFNKGTLNEKKALDDVTLQLNDGDFVTVIGGNGAGKSTLLNAIAGSFFVDGGTLQLDGEDITFMPEHKRARLIGRLFQDPLKGTAPDMTIEENMALAAGRGGKFSFGIGIGKAQRAYFRERLEKLGLGLENRMKNKMGLLSGGQRQAVTLLMATMSVPKLLLLDEHTAALDPATAEKVINLTKEIVEQEHITTLMITHNIHSALECGNRTIMMDDGKIILDINGDERKNMTVEALLQLFRLKSSKELDNDRMLLTK